MLTKEKKSKVRGYYRRAWISDDYFDLIVWYEPSNAIHGFQLCYGKPEVERALTSLKDRGFSHSKIDSGEDDPEANRTPILLPDGSFPSTEVSREFRLRSERLPKSLRNFVLAKLKQFVAK
ncbi:MAG TPA: hypothetical protein VH170_04525 [Chthoniobacterales bacterium]|jgi:hypothetical protein|nr:hypothetical protein [Chthoniobacterales bacterium]